MSNLGQGYWECWQVEGTHTRDTGEKEKNIAPNLQQVSALFFLSELRGEVKQNELNPSCVYFGELSYSSICKQVWLELFRLHFTPPLLHYFEDLKRNISNFQVPKW